MNHSTSNYSTVTNTAWSLNNSAVTKTASSLNNSGTTQTASSLNNSGTTQTASSLNNSGTTQTASSLNNSGTTKTASSFNKSGTTLTAWSLNNSAVMLTAVLANDVQSATSVKLLIRSANNNSSVTMTESSPTSSVSSTHNNSAVTMTTILPKLSVNSTNDNSSVTQTVISSNNSSMITKTTTPSKSSLSDTNDNSTAIYYVHEEDCVEDIVHIYISATVGSAVIVNASRPSWGGPSKRTACTIHLQVDNSMHFIARVSSIKGELCWGQVIAYDDLPLTVDNEIGELRCNNKDTLSLIPSRNHLYFQYSEPIPNFTPKFSVHLVTTARSLRTTLHTVFSNPLSGYVTSPGFNGQARVPNSLDIRQELRVPAGHVIMVSYPYFDIERQAMCDSFLAVSASPDHTSKMCMVSDPFIEVYNTSRLTLTLHTESHLLTGLTYREIYPVLLGIGFKMLFSFHPPGEMPVRLSNGLYNCSVPFFPSFRQHLHCNLQTQCQGGEDETGHCPFSSEECQGKVKSYDKCYFIVDTRLFSRPSKMSWRMAKDLCEAHGAHLATVKTSQELLDLKKLILFGRQTELAAHVGITLSSSHDFSPNLPTFSPHSAVSFMYRNMWQWTDRTVIYSRAHLGVQEMRVLEKKCVRVKLTKMMSQFVKDPCTDQSAEYAVCEMELNRIHPPVLHFPASSDAWRTFEKKHTFVICQAGHVTHRFLSCDAHSHCGAQAQPIAHCPFSSDISAQDTAGLVRMQVAQFFCVVDSMTVHYTLVCDHRYDCKDGSDETFCQHPRCEELQCANGQCLARVKKCNRHPDCVDHSDEENCKMLSQKPIEIRPSAVIHFHGRKGFKQTTLGTNESCPETHYRCASELTYCLPFYTRCNGFNDCIRGEDEQGCEQATCPGFYRCRKSSVCVHLDHLCDGWPQCPQGDDEWLCEMTCPAGCVCQGYAAVCLVPFTALAFFPMRYVDASGSGATLSDLSGMTYLVCLIFRKCLLRELTKINFQNLQILDLSGNQLEHVNVSVFHELLYLKELTLAENPLVTLYLGNSNTSLTMLDISNTKLSVLDSTALSQFWHLQRLNISFTHIQSIGTGAFRGTPNLTELDMRGSPIELFPRDVFKRLQQLSVIYAPTYRLCCKSVLPQETSDLTCVSHKTKVSSCISLLGSKIVQFYVWLTCALATSGNVLCAILRHHGTKEIGFDILVDHLNCVGFVKGVCLGVLGTADTLFRHQYVHYEPVWEKSYACSITGFVSLLSLEVSALILCCITLDAALNIFSADVVHFNRRSASAVAAVVWLVGSVLAAVPLFSSQWRQQLFRQTGLCVPVPIPGQHYAGYSYIYGVLGISNTLLFTVIFISQIYIYVALKRLSVFTGIEKPSLRCFVSQRMVTIAVADSVCWFLFCVLSLSSTAANSLGNVSALALSLLMVSIDCVLNPYLYLVNLGLEKRQIKRHERLIVLLKNRFIHQK